MAIGDQTADSERPHDVGLDDQVLPFQVQGRAARGRVARLGPAIDEILSRHDLPPVPARLLGDVVTLAALIGASLKFNGIFSVHLRGSGDVKLITADYVATDGASHLRGYIDIAEDADLSDGDLLRLMGEQRAMVLTIDQGDKTERYQGVVPLDGPDIASAAMAYFKQSEQIPTFISLATSQLQTAGDQPKWRSGGLLVQHLPEGGIQSDAKRDDLAEDWNHVSIMAQSIRDDELTDPMLSGGDLIWRLFHEDGARVFDPAPVIAKCRCSRDRLLDTLKKFDHAELQSLLDDDGQVAANCQFCSATYLFTQGDLGLQD